MFEQIFQKLSPGNNPVLSGLDKTKVRLYKGCCNWGHEFQAIFHLRYKVYCEELRFMPKREYPECKESDEFDAHSVHIGVFDTDDIILGTLRMIPHVDGKGLLLERHCTFFDYFQMPKRTSIAEVSRLALSNQLRKKMRRARLRIPGLSNGRSTDKTQAAARQRHIIMLMARAVYAYCKRQKIQYLLAAMEPALARQLRGLGFPFAQIGPICEYHGQVIPYMVSVAAIEIRLQYRHSSLWQWFARSRIAKFVNR